MSLYLDVACTDHRLDLRQRQEKTVQAIGEILPFVIAKYGIGHSARRTPQMSPESKNRLRRFTVE